MKYLSNDAFSVHPGASKQYRDNYDQIFKKGKEAPAEKAIEGKDMTPVAIKVKPEKKTAKDKSKPKKATKPKKKSKE